MKNSNLIYLVIFVIMIIGKICNYNKKLVIGLLKFIIGFDIIVKNKIKIKDLIKINIIFITRK